MERIEPAKTGRAACRGCGRKIAQGELRFGEGVASGYGEGESTLWFHLLCAAYKRPEALLQALPAALMSDDERARLLSAAELGAVHRRLPRIDGAERAPSARARCRACRESIERGRLRIRLVFFEEGRFNPSGFIHASCAPGYFETADLMDRLSHFGDALPEADRDELARILEEKRNV